MTKAFMTRHPFASIGAFAMATLTLALGPSAVLQGLLRLTTEQAHHLASAEVALFVAAAGIYGGLQRDD